MKAWLVVSVVVVGLSALGIWACCRAASRRMPANRRGNRRALRRTIVLLDHAHRHESRAQRLAELN